jgi:hypothetical protein
MLITSLGSLKAELAVQMFHQRFQPQYERAIQAFEAVANRRLRTRKQEHVVYLTTSSSQPDPAFIQGFCDVPDDYLLWRSVQWRGRTPFVELDYVHPAYLRSTWIETDHGDPKIFTIEDGTFFAAPVNNTAAAYEFHYYRKIDSLLGRQEGDNAANWLIDDHPDLYFSGVLFELFVLGRNGEAAVAHKQLRDEKFAELIQLSALTTGATSSKVRGESASLGSGGEYF